MMMTYDKYMQIIRNQPGLVGCWMFHKNNGNHLHDYSRHGNHGTINGATYKGNYGAGALDFDGNDDYVDCGDLTNSLFVTTPNTKISASAWIKTSDTTNFLSNPSSAQRSPVIVYNKYLDSGHRNVWGFHINNGKLRFTLWELDFGHDGDTIDGNININDNVWHYASAVYDDNSDNLKLYVDSVLDIDTSTTKEAVKEDHRNGIHIGAKVTDVSSPDSFFNGLIDEVRIFDYALSADEIKRNYDLGKQFHID